MRLSVSAPFLVFINLSIQNRIDVGFNCLIYVQQSTPIALLFFHLVYVPLHLFYVGFGSWQERILR